MEGIDDNGGAYHNTVEREKMGLKETAAELGLEIDEFKSLIQIFLDTAKTDIEKLHSAVHLNDAPAASKAAHSIKGAAGNLRLNSLFELAQRCEQEARNNEMDRVLTSVEQLQGELDSLSERVAR